MQSRIQPRLPLTIAAAVAIGLALSACDDGVLAPGAGALADAAAMDAATAQNSGPADAARERPAPVTLCAPPVFQACPGPVPSFAATILPILDASCNTCHDPNVPDGPWPLNDHGDVVAWKDSIVADLLDCTMPPADANVSLSETDRQQIFTWILCGAPDN